SARARDRVRDASRASAARAVSLRTTQEPDERETSSVLSGDVIEGLFEGVERKRLLPLGNRARRCPGPHDERLNQLFTAEVRDHDLRIQPDRVRIVSVAGCNAFLLGSLEEPRADNQNHAPVALV